LKFNIEKYKPNKSKYFSHLKEKLDKYSAADLSPNDNKIYTELIGLLPEFPEQIPPRFKPSSETVEFAITVANELNSPLLDLTPYKPDGEVFTPQEIQEVFINIIGEVFDEDWTVEVTSAASINVEAKSKLIKIPKNRKPVSYTELRSLVAHELGTHFLRSVMGAKTDFALLRTGLSDYYDMEEGTGDSIGGLVNGETQTGTNKYIAGITTLDNDFRRTHEIMWRIYYLDSVSDQSGATLQNAFDESYKTTDRFFRGTGNLPWLKDLSYDDGTEEFWQYMEQNVGDDFAIFLLFAGKNNPLKHSHRQIILETATS
jgi:hypothetical protein